MTALSSVVSGSLALLLSAAFPAASFAVQIGVAVRAAAAGPAPADLFEVAVQDTVMVVPGARYRAGWMKGWLLGDHYRALWTTRLPVAVLDLERTAGWAHGGAPDRWKATPGAAIPGRGGEDFRLTFAQQGPSAPAASGSARYRGAGAGKFSSDGTIGEYAADIGHIEPCPVS